MRLIYSALFIALLPLVVLRLLWRSRLAPAYRQRLGERLGFFTLPADSRPLIWIHAVSLGETLAARPMIQRLLDELPAYRILITSTTPTGSAQVRKLFGDRVEHVYAPWDTPGAVQRFLRRTRPRLLLLMETELWPNILHYTARQGCRIMLANARLSERSARGYARFPRTTRRMLRRLNWVAAQSAADAERFVALGLEPSCVAVSGSIKYDIEISPSMRDAAARLRRDWGLDQRPTLIAASTHEGEEALVLEAFAHLRGEFPTALLLLAPRHPERFDRAFELCSTAGFAVQRHSAGAAVTATTDVRLIDTLGELLQLFGVADIAVIGGSFIPRGGHNPLEAAAWGRAVFCGASMFNFREISRRLQASGALQTVAGAGDLAAGVERLLRDAGERHRREQAALKVIAAGRGALDAQMQALRALLDAH